MTFFFESKIRISNFVVKKSRQNERSFALMWSCNVNKVSEIFHDRLVASFNVDFGLGQ